MDKELLKKYFNNSCTDEELAAVMDWFRSSAANHEGKVLLFRVWEELSEEGDFSGVNFDLILDKIHHQVNLDQSTLLLEKADQDVIRYKTRKRLVTVLLNTAALIILPVIGFSLYISHKYQNLKKEQISVSQAYNEILSSEDAITKVTLPDGSNVWLNHSSSLKYPSVFRGDFRTVELKGEGYFEVAHNPEVPFIVNAGDIRVKAVGTVFNIMAYPDEDRIETSLIDGKVELQRAASDGSMVSLLKMKPTDLAIFQKSNSTISTRTIIDDRYFSWKNGKLVFNKEPISEVVKKLSRWFNVDIQIEDPELLDLTYTATFVHETLPQVMELLAMVSPVTYSISDREKTESGTFTKRQIVLRKR